MRHAEVLKGKKEGCPTGPKRGTPGTACSGWIRIAPTYPRHLETGKLRRQRRMPRHLRAERAQVLVHLRLRQLRRFARERAARRGARRALRAAAADARARSQPADGRGGNAARTRRRRGRETAGRWAVRPRGSRVVSSAAQFSSASLARRSQRVVAASSRRRRGADGSAPVALRRAAPTRPRPIRPIRCARVGRGALGVVLAASAGVARLSSPAARPREPTNGELAAHRRGERRAPRVVRGVEPAGRERRAEAEAPARLGRPRLGHRTRAGGRASCRVRRRGGGGRKQGYC